MALKPDDLIDESTGDLLFSSTAPLFRTELLLSRDITSRTYSFYYPRTRPEGRPRCLIVSSTNANYDDWANLSEEDYQASKQDLVETTLELRGHRRSVPFPPFGATDEERASGCQHVTRIPDEIDGHHLDSSISQGGLVDRKLLGIPPSRGPLDKHRVRR